MHEEEARYPLLKYIHPILPGPRAPNQRSKGMAQANNYTRTILRKLHCIPYYELHKPFLILAHRVKRGLDSA